MYFISSHTSFNNNDESCSQSNLTHPAIHVMYYLKIDQNISEVRGYVKYLKAYRVHTVVVVVGDDYDESYSTETTEYAGQGLTV